jgi:hypothetical protein
VATSRAFIVEEELTRKMTTLFKLLAPAQRSLHIKQGKMTIIIVIILPAPTNYRIANCVTKVSLTLLNPRHRGERGEGSYRCELPPSPTLKGAGVRIRPLFYSSRNLHAHKVSSKCARDFLQVLPSMECGVSFLHAAI